jgi:uncharacterized protein (TIGR03083 family)
MINDNDLQPLVAGTYLALAELLDAMPVERWDVASLCDGWRVREVVAHLTMPARYSEDAFMAELREDDFDFTRLSNRIAGRDAALPTSELLANLRDDALHRWTPPGGGDHGALNHVVIHSLDVTIPLGASRCASDTATRIVLDDLTEGGGHAHFGTDIRGRSLHATDIGWSYGSGPQLSGPAGELAAQISGRTVPSGQLRGETLARLS